MKLKKILSMKFRAEPPTNILIIFFDKNAFLFLYENNIKRKYKY